MPIADKLSPLWRRKKKASQIDLEQLIEDQKQRGLRGPQVIADPRPIAPPVGYTRAPSIAEQIRSAIRSHELAKEVSDAGFETFEEADDFDCPDDPPDPTTPYENEFDPSAKEILEGVDAEINEALNPPPDGPRAPHNPAEPGAKASSSDPLPDK